MKKVFGLICSIEYTLLLYLYFIVYLLLETSVLKTNLCIIIFAIQLINFIGKFTLRITK